MAGEPSFFVRKDFPSSGWFVKLVVYLGAVQEEGVLMEPARFEGKKLQPLQKPHIQAQERMGLGVGNLE